MSQAPCTLFWPRSGFTPTPGAADVAGRHGEVGHAHDHGRALAVLGDAEAVVDRAVAAGGVEPRGGAHVGRRHAGDRLDRFGRVALLGDEARPALEVGRGRSARATIGLVDQALGDDDMGQRVDARRHWCRAAAAGGSRASTCGVLHEVDAARVDDDQLRALAQPLLHARGEDRMPSVGLAPMTRMTSACSTESKSCVPAEVPSVVFRP